MAGLKPLIKYRGGKSKEIPLFEDLIPIDYSRYVEPFFGGGAVYFHLQPQHAIINDLNTKLIDFYKGVRNHFEELKSDLNRIENLYKENQCCFELKKNFERRSILRKQK